MSAKANRLLETKPNPLLRWAGSKRKLIPELISSVPPNFSVYFEPFFGSGCLFFELCPKRAVLNDINEDLINFYRFARNYPESVLRSATKLRRTAAGYYSARNRFLNLKCPIKKASFFLFLNRFCFNGLYRTNSKGEFNVPFGNRTGSFPSEDEFIKSVGLLKRARLLSLDFEQALDLTKKGDFVYLDPPYVYSARKERGEYGPSSFSIIDLPRLKNTIDALNRRGVYFLLSYIECDEISSYIGSFNVKTIPVARCISGLVSSRQVVNELLIKNF